ncbi:bacillithiol system redox-active protein YtxJ [Candidatus Latescibacterota bacterium]
MEIINITEKKTLEEAFSAEKALLFKNSSACPVSRAARGQFENFAETAEYDIALFMVNVIENRPLSSEAAERSGVVHQSPQLIYLVNGEAVWNMSHFEIKRENIVKALEKSV